MMNQTAIVSLQVLCQLNCLRAPYSNDANTVVSNPSAIWNRSSPPAVRPATLPEGYIAYPEIGAAYKIIFEKATWSEAREQCYLEGAHLAIIDSHRKIDYVHNTTYHTYHRIGSVHMHIGIYRMDHKWVSVSTVKTLSDLPWKSGYPKDSNTDCTVLQVSSSTKGIFNTADCNNKYAYLCELPIPEGYKTQENQMAQVSVN